MRAAKVAVVCGALVVPPMVTLHAQDSWQVTLSKDSSNNITMSGLVPGTNLVTGQTVQIAITCRNVDCRRVEGRVTLRDRSPVTQGPLASANASATGVTLTLQRSLAVPAGGARFLALTAEGQQLDLFALTVGQQTGEGGGARSILLSELLIASCRISATGDPYDHKANRASFVVTPLGNVISRPGDVIDENDAVAVTVVGAEQLLPRLTIRRSSDFRVSSGIRIVGSKIRILEAPGLRRQAAGQPPPCNQRTVLLHDFAPGRGEVEISVRTGDGDESLGKFEFGVNALFTGAFSFGIVRSSLADPRFGLFFNGTDSVITEAEDPSRKEGTPSEEESLLRRQRILYGMFYTPFFGRRDIEKDKLIFRPTIGFALNDISENVFVGGAFILHGSFTFMVGVHWGKVTRLDEQSDLDVGSTFGGSSDEIPTVKRWRGDVFIGVSLDIRAAMQFFQVAFGAASGS